MVTVKKKITRLPDELIIQKSTPFPNYQQILHDHYCRECGCYVTLYDNHRDENFCLNCGEIIHEPMQSNNNVPYGSYSYEQPYIGTGYTHSEKQFFRSKGRFVPHTFKDYKERKYIEYTYIVDEFKNDLCLDKVDIEDIFLIIRKCNGVNNIYRGKPVREVLIGIARYLLICKGVRGLLITFNNPIYREYGLNRRDYEKMVRNIEQKTRLYK